MKLFRIFLIILTVFTLGFIWGHSMVPREESSEESGFVKEIIDELVQSISGDSGFSISEKLVRKSAHFIEYAFLGLELALIFLSGKYAEDKYRLPIRCYLQTGIFSLCTALIDETIQSFTGRWPALLDVILDFVGSSFAILITIFLVTSYKSLLTKRKARKA